MGNNMTSLNNKATVSFVKYEPYENVPTIIATLAELPLEKILELHKKLATQNIKESSCLDQIYAEFKTYLSSNKLGTNNFSGYDLSKMFYMHEKYLPPCAGHKKPKTEEQMIRMCARNLRHGRCRDKFMQNTLGVALFPQKYAIQKENEKSK